VSFLNKSRETKMQLLSIKKLLGYGLYVEWMEWKASDKLIETERDRYNWEAWLFGRVYLVLSNEIDF
jgi:hypothetical protein